MEKEAAEMSRELEREREREEWESVRLSLSDELIEAQSTTRRRLEVQEEEKSLLECEVSLKNKTIADLKTSLRQVKDDSLQIINELEEYRTELEQLHAERTQQAEAHRQNQEVTHLLGQQLNNLRKGLETLAVEKDELKKQIALLKLSHCQLEGTLHSLQTHHH
jgi:chromosome segregation ATPase